jgi:hypothetical protein
MTPNPTPMTDTYTPGPWTRSGWSVLADGKMIADAGFNPSPGFKPSRSEEEITANARLIAAAPALLAALKAIIEEGSHSSFCPARDMTTPKFIAENCDCAQSKARAAIALATGEANG